MQIIIIGAGIAGLSSYIFLDKHLLKDDPKAHNIRIFESYSIEDDDKSTPVSENEDKSSSAATDPTTGLAAKTIGAAIGIGKNGLAVLERMEETGSVLERIKRRGNYVSKWQMGTARGWKIVDASVESAPDKKRKGQTQPTIMIARQAAWGVLRDKVLSINPEAVVQAKVVAVIPMPDGQVVVEFEDGSRCTADLVIGADGLRSVVRRKIFENTTDVEPQSWWERLLGRAPVTKDYISPHYERLTGVGGFVPSKVLKQAGYKDGGMSITFGPNGFFGHGYVGRALDDRTSDSDNDKKSGVSAGPDDEDLAGWWSTFSSTEPYPFRNTNKDDTSSKINQHAALAGLRSRHGSWKDPVIQAIISYVAEHKLIENMYPTYTTPELPTWHNEACNLVLIGDAAHALQPSSGQGACQALEDAEALALLLAHYFASQPRSGEAVTPNPSSGSVSGVKVKSVSPVNLTLHKFDTLRRPRLAAIYIRSQMMGKMKGNMNVLQEFLMYLFIWLGGKLGSWKEYNDQLFEYDLPLEVEKIIQQE